MLWSSRISCRRISRSGFVPLGERTSASFLGGAKLVELWLPKGDDTDCHEQQRTVVELCQITFSTVTVAARLALTA